MPSRLGLRIVRSKPWTIIAQSMSWNTPPLISLILPPPPSSAGVPITWIRPFGSSVFTAASAAPAPAPEVAITLCPHAWPMPGSASYSHRIAIVGPSPVSTVARGTIAAPGGGGGSGGRRRAAGGGRGGGRGEEAPRPPAVEAERGADPPPRMTGGGCQGERRSPPPTLIQCA